MPKKVNVVVFDFDGTLSAFDSNFQFGRYCFRHSVRTWFFTPLILLSVLMRPFNRNGIWWRQCMRCFLTEKMVKKLAPDFIRQHKLNRFGWALERVAAEKKAGNIVLLISASPNYLLRPLVRDMKFDAVMCSEMYGDKPWKYKFLCYNKNKVVALEKWARKNKVVVNVVRSYSDSKSDMPIMKIAHEQVWINRKTGCRVSK
ncbi:MAG: HAD-IB family phosphatase [Alphaproteobacteria bacterium]|nr:HAD-IB family phosphatase [Alphaproteobacteria bacterium]